MPERFYSVVSRRCRLVSTGTVWLGCLMLLRAEQGSGGGKSAPSHQP